MDEPQADSQVYGSSWFWKTVAVNGPADPEWLADAVSAQTAAEGLCESLGLDPWRVQRPGARVMAEMRVKKVTVKPSEIVDKKLIKGTLLEKFSPIKVIYQESSKPPVKMPTDTISIWKETDDEGKEVWRTECGLVFDCDSTGQPGELISPAK